MIGGAGPKRKLLRDLLLHVSTAGGHPLNGREQFIGRDVLADIAGGARVERPTDVEGFGVHAEDQDTRAADQDDALQKLDPAEARKVQIEDQKVDGLAADNGQRLAAVSRLQDVRRERGTQQAL